MATAATNALMLLHAHLAILMVIRMSAQVAQQGTSFQAQHVFNVLLVVTNAMQMDATFTKCQLA